MAIESKQAQRRRDVDLILRSALYPIRSAFSVSPICYYVPANSLIKALLWVCINRWESCKTTLLLLCQVGKKAIE
ncbi:hypothetical protein LOK49_LG05G02550 [Camellia lanceoleosa]|uniref:Uncharacterized protein n=1 Tax=Camellia lanceoleosa TaxID=1840588 RepID=A0ACC0HNV1_9ERIC|nr:hypothetical protein LOK49_LG05G02550 [Camellia lanceoleosa]